MFLKNVFYFGLGLVGFVYDTVKDLASRGEERVSHDVAEATEGIDIVIGEAQETGEQVVATAAAKVETVAKTARETAVQDDLTQINGIGPTFARRLTEAGITSFQALAQTPVDRIKEVTNVKEWQADPGDWVVQAQAMA